MDNNWSGKHIIGLGGSAGTGKDTALKMLSKLGVHTISADEIADRLLLKDALGYRKIVEEFGEGVLDRSGQIDRIKLYQLIRVDSRARAEFRAIINPMVRWEIDDRIKTAEQQVVAVQAADLDEFGLRGLCDQLWAVTATEEVQLSNLARKYGWTREQAERYVRSRHHLEGQLAQADVLLFNDGSPADLLGQVSQALLGLKTHSTRMVEAFEAVDRIEKRQAAAESGLTPFPEPNQSPAPSPVSLIERVDIPPDLEFQAASSPGKSGHRIFRGLKVFGGRLINVLSTLLVIAYLTSWGLILAERGREHLPAQPIQAAWQALARVGDHLIDHPQTYYRHQENIPALLVVSETLKASAGLLLLSLGVALGIGLLLGVAAALTKRKSSSALIMLVSVLGVSTPSFLIAMLLWVVNIWVHRKFDITVLPSAGFGWDAHLIMPALVLAMRPLAQIAQVTYVALRDVLQQDYIRTAHSKGLSWRMVRNVHALPNILIPTLTTLGSSLRFSLASLPVVELFFEWPGVGSTLMDAIQEGNAALVMDLILSLGLFFLIVNMLIEFSFPLIDARLRDDSGKEERNDRGSLLGGVQEAISEISAGLRAVRRGLFRRTVPGLPPLPSNLKLIPIDREKPVVNRRLWLLRHFMSNPPFILGSMALVVLMGAVLSSGHLTTTSPYQTHGVMMIEGKIGAPPFKPSSIFPWGTDHIGRDIQALVLAGGVRTLSLAFFGMLARLLLGATMGILAGWQRGSWFDNLVIGGVGVWAAFPVTLFAMILIQALGIQQGMWVFIVTISVVGWGEVAQFVRGQVIVLKPQLFIESARSVGSRPGQILGRHVLPNLVNSLIVLAVLEMGGILMLLAELGYLNIFMGGGFRLMIGEVGRMVPNVAFYSDVPEWGALIANIRQYWRSYPWMALYPGLAVFFTIMTFNLFGEGLRRFLDDTYANLSRLLNRYTMTAGALAFMAIALVLEASTPLSVYRAEGSKFDEQRVMQDIQVLSSPGMQGRETGMPGAELAARYIAGRMAEIGIFPAGEHHTYLQYLVQPRSHLFEPPVLTILDESGEPLEQLKYKEDFTEITRYAGSSGDEQARVMGAAYGPVRDPALSDEYGLSNSPAMDHILIVHADDIEKVNSKPVKGVLVIANETFSLDRRDLQPYFIMPNEQFRPYMVISPEVADALLKTAGSSLAELEAARASLEPGRMTLTAEGTRVGMSLLPRRADDFLDERYINVMGVIPGQGHFMGTEDQVIIVSAYYDGLGTDLTGRVYPGANDNASGVAAMLGLARVMKESVYQPEKTILFVAWAGGERQEGLSIVNVLNARPGASEMTVETVIELSGIGYGTGNSINLGNDSSFRLVKLFQEAASRDDLQTTTRGRNPHYGMPLPTAFGGRTAMTLSISWDESDALAHTPQDTFEIIEPAKLYDIGRTTLLTLLVVSRETDY